MPDKSRTFEQRNLINRKFQGNSFVSNNLVFLDGIYYHFQFKKPADITVDAWYQVVNNLGNQLFIIKLND